MEAFEKYAKEQDPPNEKYCCIKAELCGMKRGWRAFGEWFYGKLGYSEEHEELKDIIEKELEDRDGSV